MKSHKKEVWFCFVGLVLAMLSANVAAETIYVDDRSGNDTNPGTKEKPIRTIGQAAARVNSKTEGGPTTIKIAPGVYNLTECAVFENARPYTEQDRLVIEATILPDDPNWKPALMPVILSTEDPRKPEMPNVQTETYGLKIRISHVTIRGLKFMGNPLSNNWHACVERVGKNLDDLLVTQCMFVGDRDTMDIYCPVIANGDGLVVDHCIFSDCHASVVFWDGPETIGGKHCAMRYCIVNGGYISGVWTCRTAEDFEFHHNIVTGSEYFWLRKRGDQQKYHLRNCIVTNNKYYSGYGIESGPTGLTGAEVAYDEENITKEGKIILEKNKEARNYLHVAGGTVGSELGAGLFRK
jgi:hypothetical protein